MRLSKAIFCAAMLACSSGLYAQMQFVNSTGNSELIRQFQTGNPGLAQVQEGLQQTSVHKIRPQGSGASARSRERESAEGLHRGQGGLGIPLKYRIRYGSRFHYSKHCSRRKKPGRFKSKSNGFEACAFAVR